MIHFENNRARSPKTQERMLSMFIEVYVAVSTLCKAESFKLKDNNVSFPSAAFYCILQPRPVE